MDISMDIHIHGKPDDSPRSRRMIFDQYAAVRTICI